MSSRKQQCIFIVRVQSTPYPTTKHAPKRLKYKGPSSMKYRDRGSMHEVYIPIAVYLAYGNSKSQIKRSSRHQNYSMKYERMERGICST